VQLSSGSHLRLLPSFPCWRHCTFACWRRTLDRTDYIRAFRVLVYTKNGLFCCAGRLPRLASASFTDALGSLAGSSYYYLRSPSFPSAPVLRSLRWAALPGVYLLPVPYCRACLPAFILPIHLPEGGCCCVGQVFCLLLSGLGLPCSSLQSLPAAPLPFCDAMPLAAFGHIPALHYITSQAPRFLHLRRCRAHRARAKNREEYAHTRAAAQRPTHRYCPAHPHTRCTSARAPPPRYTRLFRRHLLFLAACGIPTCL